MHLHNNKWCESTQLRSKIISAVSYIVFSHGSSITISLVQTDMTQQLLDLLELILYRHAGF